MPDAPLLQMLGIDKSFPGVRALAGVDLELRAGEALALVGENGAGKSTLIKILGGVHRPDAGTIKIDGDTVDFATPAAAQHAGVAIIYQEFNLVPALTVLDNIFLGREQTRLGFLRRGDERTKARALFDRLGVAVDLDAPCRRLSIAQQQIVEIAKALAQDARLFVMDEPSAALSPQEVDRLFDIIRDLKRQGIGVIYISHRLDEIFAVCDRATILRDGAHVGTCGVAEVSRERLIEMMVGRTLDQEFPKEKHEIGGPRLVVRDLCAGARVRDVSFDIRRGEVLGLTGLVGAGRTETARVLFGADRPRSGTIELDGRPLSFKSPRDAIRAGICLLTEDRKGQGLVLQRSVRENFALPSLARFSTLGWLRGGLERSRLAHYVDSLRIRIAGQDQPARNLSGGNQQKVLLARWLERNAEVVLFDEPTRGIDVAAKYEIYLLINELARQGKAILLISSELPEVLGMSDRIVVMHEGRKVGEIADVADATQEQILELAVGY